MLPELSKAECTVWMLMCGLLLWANTGQCTAGPRPQSLGTLLNYMRQKNLAESNTTRNNWNEHILWWFTPTNKKSRAEDVMFLFLCGEGFHWLYQDHTLESVASQLVVDASLLFVSLLHFMNQVKFLPKSAQSAALTRDGQTALFTDTLAAKAGVERGWSTERRVDIPGGSTLENLIMFSGTQCRTRWWRRGGQRKAPSSLPFTWRGLYTAARETMDDNSFIESQKI